MEDACVPYSPPCVGPPSAGDFLISQSAHLDPLSTAASVAALLSSSSCDSPDHLQRCGDSGEASEAVSYNSTNVGQSCIEGVPPGRFEEEGSQQSPQRAPTEQRCVTITVSVPTDGDQIVGNEDVVASRILLSAPDDREGRVVDSTSACGVVDVATAARREDTAEKYADEFEASMIATTGGKVSPEHLRLLLLDHADREALFYSDDHAARRRLAVLHKSILDHNVSVRRNIRAFLLSTAETGTASPPATEKFSEIQIPSHFIDPVTKRIMSDPVVFADKRVLDRPTAEALTFRLFSTMIRCRTVGASKRQEFFTYCLDRVLVSSVAKQWRRQAFGFRGLDLTPRPDIAASIRGWIATQMTFNMGIRDAVEGEIRSELGLAGVPPNVTSGTSSPTEPEAYAVGSTMMFLSTAGADQGQGGSNSKMVGGGLMVSTSNGGLSGSCDFTPPALMEDPLSREVRDILQHVIVTRKFPKEWDTLEHMWRDICTMATRGRKKKLRGAAMLRRSVDVVRKFSALPNQSVSPSMASTARRGTMTACASPASTPRTRQPSHASAHEQHADAPHHTVPTGETVGVDDCLLGQLGVGIAGSNSFDVLLEQLSALEGHEIGGRDVIAQAEIEEHGDLMGAHTTLSIDLQRAQLFHSLGMSAGGRRRGSLASSNGVGRSSTTVHSTPAGPGQESLSTQRGRLASPPCVGIDIAGRLNQHRAVRHKVAVRAGPNHRAPHRPVLGDVMGSLKVSRPTVPQQPLSTGGEAASMSPPSSLTSSPCRTVQHDTVGPQNLLASVVPTDIHDEAVPADNDAPVQSGGGGFDLLSAIDSLTGLVSALLEPSVGRAQRVAPPKGENFLPVVGAEEVALVGATMRLHQDRELFNQAFDFSEKWFVDMEHKCMQWAEEQFTAMAEEQAKERSLGAKKRQFLETRKVLKPSACIVAGGEPTGGGRGRSRRNDPASRHNKTPPRPRPRPLRQTHEREEEDARSETTSDEDQISSSETQSDDATPQVSSDSCVPPLPSSTHHLHGGIAPSSAWRQRLSAGHKAKSERCPATLADSSSSHRTSAPSIPLYMEQLLGEGAPSASVPPLVVHAGGGGVIFKPPWAGEVERQRSRPSKSSRYVEDAGGNDSKTTPMVLEELPSNELARECAALYAQFDEKAMEREVARKRELGPYYFEPLVFSDDVARKAAERDETVRQKLEHVTMKELDRRWNQPTVGTLHGYDCGGAHSMRRAMMLASAAETPASPRLVEPRATERVPLRPCSSTIAARKWVTGNNYSAIACVHAASQVSPSTASRRLQVGSASSSARQPPRPTPPGGRPLTTGRSTLLPATSASSSPRSVTSAQQAVLPRRVKQ